MKIRKLTAIVLTLVIAISVLGASALAADPTFRGGDITAKAGDTITFPVYIENNPGIAGYKVQVDFSPEAFDLETQNADEFLSTIKVKMGDFADEGNVVSNTTKYGCVALYFNVAEVDTDGVIFNVTLKVKDDAVNGKHAVKIRYDENNTVDGDLQLVEFKTVDGSVTVSGGVDGTIDNTKVGPSETELKEIKEGKRTHGGDLVSEMEDTRESVIEDAMEQISEIKSNGGDIGNLISGNSAEPGRAGTTGTVAGMKTSNFILLLVGVLVAVAAVLLVVLRAAGKKKAAAFAGAPAGADFGGDEKEPDINDIMGWSDSDTADGGYTEVNEFDDVPDSDGEFYDDDDDIDD